MSTKHIRTAADLARFGAALRIECRECGNARTLDGFELAQLAGTAALGTIASRMKCSRCGAKAVRTAILTPPPPR